MFEQLGLIGCGLMGGSFALAMKQAGLTQRVAGYSKSPSTLRRALERGAIDVEAPSSLLAVSGADAVLIAVPVSATEDTFKAIRHLIGPDTLVMDVGSTKTDVVAAARRSFKEQLPNFVPAHPITGKETAGIEAADPGLYRGQLVILTPLPETDPRQVERAQAVWEALGCRVRVMHPQDHDAAYAAVSHLPHLLAFAAMNALQAQTEAAVYLSLAGPGFRDFTRIAASDPDVWRDILMANRDEVLRQSRLFREALSGLESALENGDATDLRQRIEAAQRSRRQWPGPATAGTPPSSADDH